MEYFSIFSMKHESEVLKGPQKVIVYSHLEAALYLWHPRQKIFLSLARWKYKEPIVGVGGGILAINMNSCLCLNSGINRGQLRVCPIIFISLSVLRCWQRSLPSCPHMPSFYLGHFSVPCKILQPKQIAHFLWGSRSVSSRSPPSPLHSIPGGAGGGGIVYHSLVICVDLSWALEFGCERSCDTVSSPYPPAPQPLNNC